MMSTKTASKRAYEIVGFERCDPWQLEPHPAAAVPIEADDVAALERSIEDIGGVLEPLIVEADFHDSPEANEGKARFVLDGCNRLNILRSKRARMAESGAGGGDEIRIPCILVHARDPRAVALECLMAGRKRSTGQRILAYIEMHKPAIMNAAEAVQGGHGNLRKAQETTGRSRDLPDADFWTARAVAERLQCSEKDVQLGIQLVREMSVETDPQRKAIVTRTRNAILAGGSPIRRWKAAVGGASAEQHGRRSADYAACILRACTSLRSSWRNFAKVNQRDLGIVAEAIGEVVQEAPEVALVAMARGVASLPDDKRAAFLKLLKPGAR